MTNKGGRCAALFSFVRAVKPQTCQMRNGRLRHTHHVLDPVCTSQTVGWRITGV